MAAARIFDVVGRMTMRKIEASDIHARFNQLGDHFPAATCWPDSGDDLGPAHLTSPHAALRGAQGPIVTNGAIFSNRAVPIPLTL